MEKWKVKVFIGNETIACQPVFTSISKASKFIVDTFGLGINDASLEPVNEEASDHISFQDYGWGGSYFYPYDM
jgi:hypothetical protein